MKENKLIQYLEQYDIFTNKDVHDFYCTAEKKLSRNTINWRIYQLLQAGLISRVGRGKYKLGTSKIFETYLDDKEISIGNRIKKYFPLIDYCIWNSTLIKEFSIHQSFNNFIIVETERAVLEAVFHYLKEQDKQVYLKPKRGMVENYLLEMKQVIILQPLFSEAPLQKKKGIPTSTLEKLLVDLVCGKEVFYFYQGYELTNIFSQAFDKYTINKSTLLRYASRRKKKQEIISLLETINRH